MATIREDTAGKIRDKPIAARLRVVLNAAADAAGIDTVIVTSGGQDPAGSGGKHTGSDRHDFGNAADLELSRDKHILDFTNLTERPIIEAFVTAAAANGATGIGAGVDYMGPNTLHVGFGSKAVWGAGGKSANAPPWLVNAVTEGWNNPAAGTAADPPPHSVAAPALGRFVVIARDGLRLRAGPGLEFAVIKTLPTATTVTVVAFEGG